MSAKIVGIAELQARYSGSYQFNMTDDPDPDYRKYLARQLRDVVPHIERPPANAQPLDISLDDIEGDVVAGLSAWIAGDHLVIDMLWVGEPLRGRGIGRRLLQMAEESAMARGCAGARVRTMKQVAYFVGAGYAITGTVQAVDFRAGQSAPAICWLTKTFV